MSRREKGFTIVELLVAIMIIAIGVIGIGTLMRESGIVGRRGQERDVAIELAHKKIEELRDYSFTDSRLGGSYLGNSIALCETFSVPDLTNGIGTVRITFEDTGYLKKVEVGVCWKKWGADQVVGETLVTYITRGGINP